MADGYGFGGEGDWKTSALLRVLKVAGAGLPGGTSFMEDYTYDLVPGEREDPRRPHARGLPDASPARSRGSRCTRSASAAARTPPAWCSPRHRVRASSSAGRDLGDRFRWVANEIDVVEPSEPLPNLPVARAVWQPRPDFATATEGWLTAGGPHHTVLTTQLGADELTDLAEVFSTELVLIDADTTRRSLAKELRWSAAYHRLAQRL